MLGNILRGLDADIAEVGRMAAGHAVELFLARRVAENEAVIGAVVHEPAIELGVGHLGIVPDLVQGVAPELVREVNGEASLVLVNALGQEVVRGLHGVAVVDIVEIAQVPGVQEFRIAEGRADPALKARVPV